jgi:hypothetical protein
MTDFKYYVFIMCLILLQLIRIKIKKSGKLIME